MLISCVPASFLAYALPRCKYLGWINNYITCAVICCILAGWTIGKNENQKWGGKNALIVVLVIAQYVLLAYNPLTVIPNRDNLIMSRDLTAALSKIDGEVYIPDGGYYGHLAGKKGHWPYVAIRDVMGSGLADAFPEGLMEKFRNGEIEYILLRAETGTMVDDLPEELQSIMKDKGNILESADYKPRLAGVIPPIHLYEIKPAIDNNQTR